MAPLESPGYLRRRRRRREEAVAGALGKVRARHPRGARPAHAHRPRPVRRRRHVALDERDRVGHALAAPLFGKGEALPAARHKLLVGGLEARRRHHRVGARLLAADAVAAHVDRRELVLRKLGRLLDDHLHRLGRRIQAAGLGQRGVVRARVVHLVQQELDVAHRHLVRHAAARHRRRRARHGARRRAHGGGEHGGGKARKNRSACKALLQANDHARWGRGVWRERCPHAHAVSEEHNNCAIVKVF